MLQDTLKRITSNEQCGFMTMDDVAELAKEDRLRQLLVRCGGCRFMCAAQDVAHLAGIIDASDSDYVRDISLPAGDAAHRGDERPAKSGFPKDNYVHRFREEDCGGAFDGFGVVSDADPGL